MRKKQFPTEIIADRVVLKKHTLELADQMFKHIHGDRYRLRQYLPWVDATESTEDSRNYIQLTLDKWKECTMFDFGIFHSKSNAYMGNIGLHSISWPNQRAEIGYWILGEFEGQGLMSDAVSALESTSFEYGFHRIEIRCSSKNIRSANIPKSLGYILDGTLRQDAIENGTFRDTLVYSKLKS